jgi:riboflavin synthase
MFTGIIEDLGTIIDISQQKQNTVLTVQSKISSELKIDQSLSHNGICLTVIEVKENQHQVCLVPETLSKTTATNWQIGQLINLERCMQFNGRLDGHLVQGHVDTTLTCLNRIDGAENWVFTFELPARFAHLVVEKGSICINGTSLTCFEISDNSFDVAIIPYTFYNTSIQVIQIGSKVNIEFDIVGKYIQRIAQARYNS